MYFKTLLIASFALSFANAKLNSPVKNDEMIDEIADGDERKLQVFTGAGFELQQDKTIDSNSGIIALSDGASVPPGSPTQSPSFAIDQCYTQCESTTGFPTVKCDAFYVEFTSNGYFCYRYYPGLFGGPLLTPSVLVPQHGTDLYVRENILPPPDNNGGGGGGGGEPTAIQYLNYSPTDTDRTCKAPTYDDLATRVNEYARRINFDRLLVFPKTDHMLEQLVHVISSLSHPEKYPERDQTIDNLFVSLDNNEFDRSNVTIDVIWLNETGFFYPASAPKVEGNIAADGKVSLRRVCIEQGSSILNGAVSYPLNLDVNTDRYSQRCDLQGQSNSFAIGSSWSDFVIQVTKACSLDTNYILSLTHDVAVVDALKGRVTDRTTGDILLDYDGSDYFINVPLIGSITFDVAATPTTFSIHETEKLATSSQQFTLNFAN